MKLEKTRSILMRRIPNDLVELVFDFVDVFNVDENVQRINATIQVGFRMFTGNIDLSDSLFYVQQSPPFVGFKQVVMELPNEMSGKSELPCAANIHNLQLVIVKCCQPYLFARGVNV